MARRKKGRSIERSFNPLAELSEETVHGVVGIGLFVLALLLVLAAIDLAGPAGGFVFFWLERFLGLGYYLLPLMLFLVATTLFRSYEHAIGLSKTLGGVLFVLAGLGLIELASDGAGGVIGALVSNPLVVLMDVIASYVLLFGLVLVSLLLIFDTHLHAALVAPIQRLFARRDDEALQEEDEGIPEPVVAGADEDDGYDEGDEGDSGEEGEEPEEDAAPTDEGTGEEDEEKRSFREMLGFGKAKPASDYQAPPLSLLERDRGKPGSGDTKANANLIKRTLANFGIRVEMDEISVGPTVTRYSLKPAEGVRISKIVSLQSNLELALAASPVRIEAPIPGKSLVGIEVPNSQKATLGLATLFSQREFKDSSKPLLVVLGRDITGVPHFADINKMPHLLVAGTTGSGKSATIHAFIASLLYRMSPEQLRFIMVDPKRVELTLYNGIPHLLTPVITEPKKALLALKWAIKEMERRYTILETERVRDIGSYHENIVKPGREAYNRAVAKKGEDAEDLPDLPESMPYLVVIVDEMSDLMQAYPRELEAAIVRLAQMSRAVGIHLMLSTQRPSVNVITGLIKANVPARVALNVNSQIDSRTILDTSGAEKLLGAGDMLFLSGESSRPRRIQAPFITENEVKAVVKYLGKHNDPAPEAGLDLAGESGSEGGSGMGVDLDEDEGDEDDRYDEARELVVRAQQASTSFLQRKMGLGYGRAARIIDMLEERGVIGPQRGSKPREVLAGRESESDDEEDGDDESDEE